MTNPLTRKSRRRPDAPEAEQGQVQDNRDLVAFFDKARTGQERRGIIQQAEFRAQRNGR
jgi:hypothetical protein